MGIPQIPRTLRSALLFSAVPLFIGCGEARDTARPPGSFRKIVLDHGAPLFGTVVCQSDTTLILATAASRDTVITERASTYTDVQLSFRDNAGTRGDMTGTIPAISFTGSFTGVQKLSLTLKTIGVAVMGIRLIHSGGAYSMYESEWIIVP